MLPEFVNAIITLNTTGSYELYSGKTAAGGKVIVSVEAKNAEGYNSKYFKIKQTVIEPSQQAYIQKFDVASLELVHKMILMSIEEGYHGKSGRSNIQLNERAGEANSANEYDNLNPTIPVVPAKSRRVNKVLSTTPIPAETIQSAQSSNAFTESEYPGGIDSDLESFMGSGIKIANMHTNTVANGQAAAKHRDSIESLLDSSF